MTVSNMPSISPGPLTPTPFAQILPGAPADSLQTITSYTYRHKRYIAYISGRQLNIVESPTKLVQAIQFSEELVALAADSEADRLVVAGKENVWVLKPITEGWTKVWWEKTLLLLREDAGDEAQCLSWGSEGEILVGGTKQVSLFATRPVSRTASPTEVTVGEESIEARKPLWSKHVASPIQQAQFSPSASMIATYCRYERMVKIWRRLSFEDGLFDYGYLPHPGPITHLEWRPLEENLEERRGSGISGRHDDGPEVLYTIASDGILRIWKTGGSHDMAILVLHNSLDLVSSIPLSPSLTVKGSIKPHRPARYAFILTADKFCAAVAAAVSCQSPDQSNHTLEHLKEVISNAPDVVVTLDGSGRMSAWGLQSIAHKRRSVGGEQAFHITHAEDLLLRLPANTNARFNAWFEGEDLHLLVHSFDGEVRWWQGKVGTFFSLAASGPERLREVAAWSGHNDQVHKIVSGKETTSVTTWSGQKDTLHWTRDEEGLLVRETSNAQQDMPSSPSQTKDIDFETGLSDPSIVTSTEDFAAIASKDGKDVVIIDLAHGYIEHQQNFDDMVRHLSFFNPSDEQTILAVGHDSYVEILIQSRYEHHSGSQRWILAKTVSIAGLGLNIKSIEWIKDGSLALAVGNGIFLTDNIVPAEGLDKDIKEAIDLAEEGSAPLELSDLSTKLNAPLPLWHPHLISHLVHDGQPKEALGVFQTLTEKLKFWSEGDPLHLLDDEEDFSVPAVNRLEKDAVDELLKQLDERDLPELSMTGQDHLKRVLKALIYLSDHVDGLDSGALRYLYSWRLQLLELEASHEASSTGQNGVRPSASLAPDMNWREIAFASHSTTQQPLLDILTLHYDNKITWPIARALGITAWLSDEAALAHVFEALAQSTYRQTSPPDPINPSLFFLALHKKQTLIGLWRIATWHKEQRATMNFLKRDFAQPDAKTAAKKNAYALMGKRRFEYAAAFFLLAGDGGSAVSLLAGQCEDVMLAVAVARLYGGDNLEYVKRLVEDRLLPQAEKKGDRWMMSWCHSLLGQRQEAAAALVKPLSGLRYWRQDDPITMVLYRDLRKRGHECEYEAVLRASEVLRRMGLWIAASELVSTWDFQEPELSPSDDDEAPEGTNGVSAEPPSMLDAFTSEPPKPTTQEPPSMLHAFASEPAKLATQASPSMLDDFAAPAPVSEKEAREAKATELLKKMKEKKAAAAAALPEKKKPEPTQFKEPDANSLLDSFGL